MFCRKISNRLILTATILFVISCINNKKFIYLYLEAARTNSSKRTQYYLVLNTGLVALDWCDRNYSRIIQLNLTWVVPCILKKISKNRLVFIVLNIIQAWSLIKKELSMLDLCSVTCPWCGSLSHCKRRLQVTGEGAATRALIADILLISNYWRHFLDTTDIVFRITLNCKHVFKFVILDLRLLHRKSTENWKYYLDSNRFHRTF